MATQRIQRTGVWSSSLAERTYADVNGDGSIQKCGTDATLIVPSNHNGGRRVEAELMVKRRTLLAASSLNKEVVKE